MARVRSASFAKFGIAALLAACAGSSEPVDPNHDPLLEAPFQPRTPAELVAFDLPEGFGPGDRLHRADLYGRKGYSRFRRQPAPGLYTVFAYGRERSVELVQVAIPDEHQKPIATFAAEAGVKLGDVVAGIQVGECRNAMRMSQDHVARMRYREVLRATDRKGAYLLQRRDVVDSVVWLGDPALLAVIDGEFFDAAFARVEAALAAKQAAASGTALATLEALAAPPAAAPLAPKVRALREQVAALARAHDAALHARLDELAAPALEKVRAASGWAAVDACHDLLLLVRELEAQLLGSGARPSQAALAMLEAAAQREAGQGPADTAAAPFWKWLSSGGARANPSGLRDLAGAVRELDAATTYARAFELRKSVAKALGKESKDDERFWRNVLSRAAAREAKDLRAAGRGEAARFVEGLVVRLATLGGVVERDQLEHPESVKAFCARLDAYEALRTDAERIAWLHAATTPYAYSRRGGGRPPGNEDAIQQHFHVTDYLEAFAARFRADADAAAARGHFATAAKDEVRQVALWRAGWSDPANPLAALPPRLEREMHSVRALRHLQPLLGLVVPPLDSATTEGRRLAELLREGTLLDAPLARWLAWKPEPRALADQAAPGGRHAWLVRKGDGFVIEVRDRPQTGSLDALFLDRLSGLSSETIQESQWLKGESEWMDKEKKEIEVERARVDQLTQAVLAKDKKISEDRARLDRTSRAAVDEFNRKLTAMQGEAKTVKAQNDALNARVAALNTRVQAYNPRVTKNNERSMRERAAGAQRLDGVLRAALDTALKEGIAAYVAELRAKGPAGPELEAEIAALHWFFDPRAAALASWATFVPPAFGRLHMEAIERNTSRHSTHGELANELARWWYWSGVANEPFWKREKFMTEWAKDFRWKRDITILRTAVTQCPLLSPEDRTRLQGYCDRAN